MATIINPGTHSDPNATLANAETIAAEICKDLKIPATTPARAGDRDFDGWFSFNFIFGDFSVEVDIPGDDPDTVCKGKPFVSRRLYVDGNSRLYGYALGFIHRGMNLDDPEPEKAL